MSPSQASGSALMIHATQRGRARRAMSGKGTLAHATRARVDPGSLLAVPSFVPPESCAFEIVNGQAVVRLSGFTVEDDNGWSVLPRLTLVVVDGPGDEGFLLRRMDLTGADPAPPGWDYAVEAHGRMAHGRRARANLRAPDRLTPASGSGDIPEHWPRAD